MAKLRVTAGLNELLSLVTFFAAAKKVTPAPGRGSANKPTRKRDPAKPKTHLRSLLPRRLHPRLPLPAFPAPVTHRRPNRRAHIKQRDERQKRRPQQRSAV